MLLLEADGKALLRSAGIAVPEAVRLDAQRLDTPPPGHGPWVVKAQVPVGGRGKAGGVVAADSVAAVHAAAQRLLGTTIKGCIVAEVLVEAQVRGAECYLSLAVDAAAGALRLLYVANGGVEVESAAEDRHDEAVAPEREAVEAAIARLAATLPAERRAAVEGTARRLADLFFREGLLLAEINPLFVTEAGEAIAGDAKIVLDMNVVAARPALRALVEEGRARYPDAWRKLSEDFDFVEIDRRGTIGLVTTGAGLSMMLIDELCERGLAPYNFCDVRTGQMRGSPARLLRILDWLAEADDVRVVLVNVFAGITDLGEFAQLLVDALAARPGFGRPVVARLVGNGEAAAASIVAAHPRLRIDFVPDLERAIDRVAALLAPEEGAGRAA